jgi:hypothetical protein
MLIQNGYHSQTIGRKPKKSRIRQEKMLGKRVVNEM